MARTTIVMIAAFLLLGGGVFALEKFQPAPAESQTVYVLDVKDTDVQRIDLQTTRGTTAFERAEPLGWKFASGAEADLSRVSSVVNRLAKLRSSAKVPDKGNDMSQYGLAPPANTATLTMKDGTTNKILIGSKTPNDAAYYAMVEGRVDLHTINTLLVGDIEKLVSEPPVPSPTAGTVVVPTAIGTPAPPPSGVAAEETPTPTVGLPAPAAVP